ncbi:uncharacterized protein LOC117176577 [Belonocnema kinseyi]|uniref:uncharacterized protein LOC117176577 n=1 Tax=Belonocnema kinseyi TaxID=2817044 RepID=UPI00143D60A3|nr:uncharacterized protein LOC117176577 [Belonocnema kinseyi]
MTLSMFFDAYETGNGMGAHCGAHNLGAAYTILHSIPPICRSSLQNIFLAMLFHHDDLKKSGNSAVFSNFIDEFNYLVETGKLVQIKTERIQVYFSLVVLEGDNLGLNKILGNSESFSANHFCRMCKMCKVDAQYAIIAENNLLRNEINYDTDVESNDFGSTGIKEGCVFNNVRHFPCVRNIIADLMHDLPEGVLAYEAGLIFHELVLVEKVIDFDIFNSILRTFDFQFESNRPPAVSVDQLRKKYIKMSGSEMMTFWTYAPIMFGRFIQEDNVFWQVFIKLRRILAILMSKQFDFECFDYLDNLITEHHAQYIELFGPLKPKHHFMVHCSLVISMMGPLEQLQAMKDESKHRKSKLTSNSVSTRVNICKTIAIKQQLMFSNRLLLNKGFDLGFSSGRLEELSGTTSDALFNVMNCETNDFLTADFVKVFNTQYKIEFTVIINLRDDFPVFAKIREILISYKNNDAIFFCDVYKSMGFCEHFYAYHLVKTAKKQFVKQSDLWNYIPVLMYKHSNGKTYVIMKNEA